MKAYVRLTCKERFEYKKEETKGYKSILKKCIHENDNLMMNYLLPIVNLTPEASIEACVDSLDDLANMIRNVNSKVIALFDNAFVKNKACYAITNIKWYEIGKKTNQIIIKTKDSFLSKKKIIARNKYLANITDDARSNVINVEVKMLKTDWINENGSLYELLILISEANEELFKTDLFKTLLGGFWDDLSSSIKYICFYPYFLYFLFSVIYLSHFLT